MDKWRYENEKGEQVEIDITSIDSLYNQIAKNYKECKGIKPAPVANPDAKVITQEELFDLMKQQLLKGKVG